MCVVCVYVCLYVVYTQIHRGIHLEVPIMGTGSLLPLCGFWWWNPGLRFREGCFYPLSHLVSPRASVFLALVVFSFFSTTLPSCAYLRFFLTENLSWQEHLPFNKSRLAYNLYWEIIFQKKILIGSVTISLRVHLNQNSSFSQPEVPHQTDDHRSKLLSTYGAEELYRAKRKCNATQEHDINLLGGELVAVLEQKDPLGSTSRWFVDTGCKFLFPQTYPRSSGGDFPRGLCVFREGQRVTLVLSLSFCQLWKATCIPPS